MFRLVKIENDNTEILFASEDETLALSHLIDYVVSSASNGDEYTSCDIDRITEQRFENIGSYRIEVDEVSILTDSEIVARGGGVCAHCHSDDTDPDTLSMDDGFITRDLTCNICNQLTVEQYVLTGIEE
jgi:hypothetical protein